MLLFYRCIIKLLFPLVVIIIFLRIFLGKEDKIRYREKIFKNTYKKKKNNKKLIWFHAASIGELKSIFPLIKELDKKNRFQFLITTVTLSSAQLIESNLIKNKNIFHQFFPIDKPSLVEKFLNHYSPNLVIFVDSEIWPNFLIQINKRKIKLILLNARITKKTFFRWKLIPQTARKIFKTFNLSIASSNESKKYLLNLGAKNIKYFGNLKFTTEAQYAKTIIKDKNKLNNKKFWCALSTHPGEEVFCLKTHLKIKEIYKDIITIIIPRHINRAKNIETICKKYNLNSQILSKGELIKSGKEIIIINSYGVIPDYIKFCKSVFIGKSKIKKLKNVGGQNPIEAAKFGCKIYHGPYIYNFKEIYELLNKYKIAKKIKNENDLYKKIIFDLKNKGNIGNKKIIDINKLGKKILYKTNNEIKKYL